MRQISHDSGIPSADPQNITVFPQALANLAQLDASSVSSEERQATEKWSLRNLFRRKRNSASLPLDQPTKPPRRRSARDTEGRAAAEATHAARPEPSVGSPGDGVPGEGGAYSSAVGNDAVDGSQYAGSASSGGDKGSPAARDNEISEGLSRLRVADDGVQDESEDSDSAATVTDVASATLSTQQPTTLSRAAIEIAQRQAVDDVSRLPASLNNKTPSSTGGTNGSTVGRCAQLENGEWSSIDSGDQPEVDGARQTTRPAAASAPRTKEGPAGASGASAPGKDYRGFSPVTALQDLPLESASSSATGSLADEAGSQGRAGSGFDATLRRTEGDGTRAQKARRSVRSRTSLTQKAVAEDAPVEGEAQSRLHQVRGHSLSRLLTRPTTLTPCLACSLDAQPCRFALTLFFSFCNLPFCLTAAVPIAGAVVSLCNQICQRSSWSWRRASSPAK
jgi:hypothetical protein